MMAKTCRYRIGRIKTEKDRPLQELLNEYPRLIDTDGMVIHFHDTVDITYYFQVNVHNVACVHTVNCFCMNDLLMEAVFCMLCKIQ